MIRGFCFLEIIKMTTDALRGEALTVERSHGSYFVARVAIHSRVGTNQRKAVLVLVDVMNRNLPARVSMADVTLRTIFPPMNVGVAILALLADIGEHKIGVTVLAR